MKKRVFVLALAMALSIAGAVTGKVRERYRAVRFIDSVNPAACLSGSSLPTDCTALANEVICSIGGGGFTRTYYIGTSCVVPYYKWPQ